MGKFYVTCNRTVWRRAGANGQGYIWGRIPVSEAERSIEQGGERGTGPSAPSAAPATLKGEALVEALDAMAAMFGDQPLTVPASQTPAPSAPQPQTTVSASPQPQQMPPQAPVAPQAGHVRPSAQVPPTAPPQPVPHAAPQPAPQSAPSCQHPRPTSLTSYPFLPSCRVFMGFSVRRLPPAGSPAAAAYPPLPGPRQRDRSAHSRA